MDVIQTIRAALPRDFREPSQERLRELRAMEYADYLQTPEWRRRRDARIHLANRRCQRCDARRELQVHHLSYERLGAEWDTDLEVLCRSCHEGHHFDESRRQHLGIYIKLASDAMRAEPFTTTADLIEAVRDRCVAARVPYRHDRVRAAVDAVTTNRIQARRLTPVPATSGPTGGEIGRQEAVEILKRFGIQVPFREIPRAAWSDVAATERQLEAARAADREVY